MCVCESFIHDKVIALIWFRPTCELCADQFYAARYKEQYKISLLWHLCGQVNTFIPTDDMINTA
jgi:hypothetical protein